MTINEMKFLEERISGLTTLMNARFESMLDKLDEIDNKIQYINEKIETIEKTNLILQHQIDTKHINCPVRDDLYDCEEKVDNIEEKIQDINFFIRHPKLIVVAVTVITILTLMTFLSNNPLHIFNNILK